MRLALVDIETTGWDAALHRVLEVGVVIVENGEIVGTFETLLNPESRVSSKITDITGITSADVVSAPRFWEIAPRLLELLDGALFVAHNVMFDYSFISSEFARLGTPFHVPRACTVRLSRKMFPEIPRHRLEDLIRFHQIKTERRHRALDDAKVLFEILQKCEARWGREDLHATLDSLTSSYRLPR